MIKKLIHNPIFCKYNMHLQAEMICRLRRICWIRLCFTRILVRESLER